MALKFLPEELATDAAGGSLLTTQCRLILKPYALSGPEQPRAHRCGHSLADAVARLRLSFHGLRRRLHWRMVLQLGEPQHSSGGCASAPAWPGRQAGPDAAPVGFLREYSNYLNPKLGFTSADTWALIATVIRNILLNWLVLLPLFASVLALPMVVSTLILWLRKGPPASLKRLAT